MSGKTPSVSPQTLAERKKTYSIKEAAIMSIPKHRRVNANKIRKQTPHPPHGKVKSFKELVEE
ncbi:DUF6254 family protein [Paenibacillus apiarius]|uniref:DUF6254 family protein n=1 Tax=Paenibacillus apiarius TaxID=46240 RepID=A0ABT4DUS1_9BACL|nr:DUF6254 family protein [Paenibacillus apiarius]MCY9514370.1 DUF6254 family protein [Paenibacillus apiarius]MCY9521092.1 DUF6254 family protein [Paenibacillus apiarius]MCY9551939.1 DUF6254 family protein [Paenibacillus apiarius]MCY9557826.1 DUF6254 family protein [Paenibacillus apiarius]MCY9684513.1 DUF6254 family protein [Paenibacillus apiarius]